MLKFIALGLIGVGIYIGATYEGQIDDIVNTRPLEQVLDMYEDVREQVSDQADELSKKLDEFNK